MALYGTFAHTIWCFVSCLPVVSPFKEPKSESSIWACAEVPVISGPEGDDGLNLWSDCQILMDGTSQPDRMEECEEPL